EPARLLHGGGGRGRATDGAPHGFPAPRGGRRGGVSRARAAAVRAWLRGGAHAISLRVVQSTPQVRRPDPAYGAGGRRRAGDRALRASRDARGRLPRAVPRGGSRQGSVVRAGVRAVLGAAARTVSARRLDEGGSARPRLAPRPRRVGQAREPGPLLRAGRRL